MVKGPGFAADNFDYFRGSGCVEHFLLSAPMTWCISIRISFLFPVAQQANTRLGRHIVAMSKPHTIRHTQKHTPDRNPLN